MHSPRTPSDGETEEYMEPQWGTNAHTRRDIRCEAVFPNWKSEGFPSRPGGFSAFLYNCPDGKQPSARNGAAADCTCAGVTTGQCGDEIRECQRRAAAAGVSNASALVPGLRNQLLCQNYANNTHIPGFENDFTPLGSCVIGENCQAAFDETPFPCLTGYANEDNSACESCPTNWRRKFDDDNDRWTCERSKVDREEFGPLRKGQTSSNDGICTIAGWNAEDLDTTVGRIWGCRIPLWEMDQAKFLQGELAGTQYDGCVVHDQHLWQSCGGRTRTHNGRTYLCDCDDAGEAVGDWRTHGLPIDLDGPGGAQLPLLFTFNCPGALEPADYTGREHQKVCACPREGWSGVERGECRKRARRLPRLGGQGCSGGASAGVLRGLSRGRQRTLRHRLGGRRAELMQDAAAAGLRSGLCSQPRRDGMRFAAAHCGMRRARGAGGGGTNASAFSWTARGAALWSAAEKTRQTA